MSPKHDAAADELPVGEADGASGRGLISHNTSWTAPQLFITTIHDGLQRAMVIAAPTDEGTAITIGRGDQADIDLPDLHISRAHLQLSSRGGRIVAQDAGSKWGTTLNGRALTAASELNHGDQLVIGKTVVRYVCYWDALAHPSHGAHAPHAHASSSARVYDPPSPLTLPAAARLPLAMKAAKPIKPIAAPALPPAPWELNLKIAALVVLALCLLYCIPLIFAPF